MAGRPDLTVQVLGARELRRAMKKAGADLKDLTSTHRKIGQMVQTDAERDAPRRTGQLASSLRSSPTTTKARVSSRLSYAAPIHWGVPSRGIEPQPWISRAAQRTQGQWIGLYETTINELIDQVESSTPP